MYMFLCINIYIYILFCMYIYIYILYIYIYIFFFPLWTQTVNQVIGHLSYLGSPWKLLQIEVEWSGHWLWRYHAESGSEVGGAGESLRISQEMAENRENPRKRRGLYHMYIYIYIVHDKIPGGILFVVELRWPCYMVNVPGTPVDLG